MLGENMKDINLDCRKQTSAASMAGQFVPNEATCAQIGAVDKPYPIFKLRDKIEEKTGWDGYADTDRR